jgi:cytochrome oxidase Cu insertion factor (SCO1/SenC/PrrC family)
MFQLRPDLPGGFVSQVARPSLQGAPSIITDVINPLLNLWNTHPIKADVLSGWLQLLIGITMIFLNSGRVLQLILWMSVLWSAMIFVFGNGFGIFYHGASFVSGAPAAILIYGFVSLYLLGLAREANWTKNPKTLSISVAAFLFLGGVLQAMPGEGYWGNSLATMFSGMASANQPGIFSRVIQWASDAAQTEPVLTNAIFILLIFGSAISLVAVKKKWAVWLAILVTVLGWWFGQDFGIFSSTATDFNSGLPLILVLSAILRQYRTDDLVNSSAPAQSAVSYKTPLAASSLVFACLFGTLVSLLVFSISIFGVDSAAMATVDSSGYEYLSPTAAPGFTLMNFNHRAISLSSIEGSPILLTFLDPSCPHRCQTMTKEMIGALQQLGKSGNQVKLVAIDVNPSSGAASDASSFVRRYGRSDYKNWYFLSGSKSQLRKVLKSYNIDVVRTKNGAVRYSQVFYFIDNLGVERGLLQDTATAAYAGSYSTLIADNLKGLL